MRGQLDRHWRREQTWTWAPDTCRPARTRPAGGPYPLSPAKTSSGPRRVHFAGCTTSPDEKWMKQVARNLTDACDGFLAGTRYVLRERDTKFCAAFRSILVDTSVKSVRLPARSQNLNAHLERFRRSLKGACLDRMIFFGDASLQRAISEFLAHYITARETNRARASPGSAENLCLGSTRFANSAAVGVRPPNLPLRDHLRELLGESRSYRRDRRRSALSRRLGSVGETPDAPDRRFAKRLRLHS